MVARGIASLMQFGFILALFALNIMAGRHAICFKVPRGLHQIFEFHPFIAANAGHWRCPGQITICKVIDHSLLKDIFIIQHVMRKAHILCHAARVMNINTCATRAFLCQSGPMIVKLQSNANHIIAFTRQLCGHNGTVDTARHGYDDACFRRWFCKP